MGTIIIIGAIVICAGILFYFIKSMGKNKAESKPFEELVKEEKEDTLLPGTKTKRPVISKKDKNRIKGLRDNAIAEKRRTMALEIRPLKSFGGWAPVRYFNQERKG